MQQRGERYALPSPPTAHAAPARGPAAYVRAGSVAAAAHELGIMETTARQHLSGLYRRTGCHNAVQAAYLLGATDGRAA
jgi:hypothetical protein